MLHFYVFCSKLERHLQGLALELKKWNTPTEILQSRTWRSPDHIRKRRRTDYMDKGNGSNVGSGGGGNDGPVEAGEFDGNLYTNISKWRDEIVKDGMEGRGDGASGWLQFEGRDIPHVPILSSAFAGLFPQTLLLTD